jgi:glycyl-tRNA synthetase alpha subunit
MLENLPSCLLPKPSKFRNVFIQSHDCSSIDEKTEEVSFVQDNADVFWVFGMGLEKCLLKPDKLMVLVFRSNLLFI